MEKYIVDILGASKEFIGVLAFLFIYHKYKVFFIDAKSLITKWLGLDNDSKIEALNLNLKNIKQSNPKLKESIEFQIDNLIYSNITGYSFSRKKQLLYLDFYNKVKYDLSKKQFKMLYDNSKINDDRIVTISVSKSTKIDLAFRYFMSSILFIVSIGLFILSFFINKETPQVKFFISIMLIVSLLFSVFLMSENIRVKHFLKKIEIYEGLEI